MAQHEGTFERAAEGALAALGGRPDENALDVWVDPTGAAEVLGGLEDQGSVFLRAVTDLSVTEPGFAPDPEAPWWLKITRGSQEIRACSSHHPGDAGCETRRVTRIIVETAPLPESETGAVARAFIQLDRGPGPLGTKVLVGEAWARDEATAVGRLRAVASRLARVLSVPASLPSKGSEEAEARGSAPPLKATTLARFSFRSEGPRIVLRDMSSTGPREGAGLHLTVGLGFSAAAAFAWWTFSKSIGQAGFTSSGTLAWLGGSILLTLAAVAFLGVAQFARRYRAGSAPLAAIGGGKLIVAPWVSRNGAVGLDLEGRFGAAIDLAEVRGISVQDRGGRHAIEAATDHGPLDVLVTSDAAVAGRLSAALSRAVDDLRPGAAPNARQRARSRAAAAAT